MMPAGRPSQGKVFYHSGPPGLRVGQRILPATLTGARSTASYGANGVCDPTKVYVTPDPKAAAMFASMNPSGDGRVYKVRPTGDIEEDPDCNVRGLSYSCTSAVIVGRVKIKRKTLRRVRAAFLEGART